MRRERTYRCLLCLDSGTVICVHTKTLVEAAWQIGDTGHWNGEPRLSCAAACTCATGDEYHKHKDRKGEEHIFLRRYDKQQYLRMDGYWNKARWITEVTAYLAWHKTERVKEMPGYDPRFEAYNRGENF